MKKQTHLEKHMIISNIWAMHSDEQSIKLSKTYVGEQKYRSLYS